MKNRIMKMALSAICLAGILATAASARADTTTYSLTTGNTALSGYTGPFGSVTVNLTDSTHATITFTSGTVGGNIYLFGDGSTVDVNVNATSWSLSGLAGSNAGTGFTTPSLSDGGSGNVDGFGQFNQTINDFDGFDYSADSVSFTLTDTSGTWASATDVLKANKGGSTVAAHIFVTSSPAYQTNGAVVTGYAANGSPVPDGGSTIALLGFALLGVGALRQKFSRN